MPVLVDLQAAEDFLRAQAALKAQEATDMITHADAIAASIVLLDALDTELDAAADVIEQD